MAQFWIALFFILLAIAQFYQSIKDINLPFPVYLVLGTILAVAANPQHKFSFVPTQRVTLEEIKTPHPALTTAAQTSPVLTTTDTLVIAPVAVVDKIDAKHSAPVIAATKEPETAPEQVIKPKKPRKPKATPKSKTV